MADITLHTSNANQITCVSNAFIDNFMNDADGEYVKIYLYLLRSLGRKNYTFSIEDMADHLDHTQKDILKALSYWGQKGVIRLEYDGGGELSGICLTDLHGHDTAIAPVSHSSVELNTTVSSMNTASKTSMVSNTVEVSKKKDIPNYTTSQRNALSNDPEVQEIMFVAQQYLGKILSEKDTNTLLFWFDELHMNADLIEYLIESRVESGHTSIAYMNTVALAWAEEGITTTEAAKAAAEQHFTPVNLVIKSFGIKNRDLVDKELSYVNKWFKEYALSSDLIQEACQRTIISTGSASFSYADAILMEWFNKGITSLEQVNGLDAEHTKSFNKPKTSQKATGFTGYTQRNYDYDALQKKLVNK